VIARPHDPVVTVLCVGSEKAGGGGSTPSLATIIPNNLVEIWRQKTGKITPVDHPRLLDEPLSSFLVQTHGVDHLCLSSHG